MLGHNKLGATILCALMICLFFIINIRYGLVELRTVPDLVESLDGVGEGMLEHVWINLIGSVGAHVYYNNYTLYNRHV